MHCRRELVWYYQDGANHIFPDAWEKFVEPIPVVSCICFLSTAYYFVEIFCQFLVRKLHQQTVTL